MSKTVSSVVEPEAVSIWRGKECLARKTYVLWLGHDCIVYVSPVDVDMYEENAVFSVTCTNNNVTTKEPVTVVEVFGEQYWLTPDEALPLKKTLTKFKNGSS